jgi:hypothetical protein
MDEDDIEPREKFAAMEAAAAPAKHPVVGPYVPKHWRIFGEMIRTAAAVIAVCVNVTVLILLVSR